MNTLVRGADNVWSDPDRGRGIDYSDGDAEELALAGIIGGTTDRSSRSPAFRGPWSSWCHEYHLSPARANLLDGLPLPSSMTVLELGCGCGAISRWLGEQGHRVDAVEGGRRRAAIAAARCRDLDTVRVVHADFDHLELPASSYDLVLFIGVLEYAGRYRRRDGDPDTVVAGHLRRALAAAGSHGVVVVAIENRIGLRYLYGAREDHYNRPLIGTFDYPPTADPELESRAGTRTWDRRQWGTLLADLGDLSVRWLFPFPDYKLPQFIAGEALLRGPRCLDGLFEGLAVVDHLGPWRPGADFESARRAALAGGYLPEVADSFLIVMGRDDARVAALTDIDVVVHGDRTLDERWWHGGRLTAGQWTAWGPTDAGERGPLVAARPAPRPLLGRTLAADWRAALAVSDEPGVLAALLADWHALLDDLIRSDGDAPAADLVLGRVGVDCAGRRRWIDAPWRHRQPQPLAFALFRSLLEFAERDGALLDRVGARAGFSDAEGFIGWSFTTLGLDFASHRRACLERLAGMLDALYPAATRPDPAALLGRALDHADESQLTAIAVYWAGPGQHFAESRRAAHEFRPRPGMRRWHVELPAGAAPVARVRIDPVDHRYRTPGIAIEPRRLALRQRDGDGSWRLLADWEGGAAVRQAWTGNGLHWVADEHAARIVVSSTDPRLSLDLAAVPGYDGRRPLALEIELAWPATR